MKDIKIFLKKKKKTSNNIVMNVINISQKIKKNKQVEYRKNYYKMRKNALFLLYESILMQKVLLLQKEKYEKLFSFALKFEKFTLNKQKFEKKSKKILFFRLCKFLP